MKTAEELITEAAERQQRIAEAEAGWQRGFRRFVQRATIVGLLLALVAGGMAMAGFRSAWFLITFPAAWGIAAWFCASRWPGILQGTILFGSGGIGAVALGLLLGTGFSWNHAGYIGHLIVLVFAMASFPLIGGLFGLWTQLWHDDHQHLAYVPRAGLKADELPFAREESH